MNFQPDLNSDDAKGIFILKISITLSKSYTRDGGGREREEREKEREDVSLLHVDIKLCFLVQYIHYQVRKENFFGYVLEI